MCGAVALSARAFAFTFQTLLKRDSRSVSTQLPTHVAVYVSSDMHGKAVWAWSLCGNLQLHPLNTDTTISVLVLAQCTYDSKHLNNAFLPLSKASSFVRIEWWMDAMFSDYDNENWKGPLTDRQQFSTDGLAILWGLLAHEAYKWSIFRGPRGAIQSTLINIAGGWWPYILNETRSLDRFV